MVKKLKVVKWLKSPILIFGKIFGKIFGCSSGLFYLLTLNMYPYLSLWGLSLSMTGLGIVTFLFLFILIAQKKATQQGLQFRALLRYFPLIIITGYLLGTRSWYFFDSFIIFPIDPKQRLLYLSPYEYHFHFSGLLFGIGIGRYKFLRSQRRETHLRRRTILFESLCIASIPLGLFLLFGDNFIGKPINTGLFISAIDAGSKVAAYDKVIPLGAYLSAGSGLLYIAIVALHNRKKHIYRAFPGLMLYRCMVGLLLTQQIYPRHIVTKLGSLSFDSKQYVCLVCIGIIAWVWYRIQTSSSLNQQLDETNVLTER